MDLELRDKVVIVTGGSRGLGRAMCHAFADEGADVALCARGEERLRETETELRAKGVRVLAEPVDVSEPGAIEAFVARVAGELGRVDVLVNNAGGSVAGDDDAAWQASIDVNLMAAVRASRAAIAHMDGDGAILNITSIYGRESGGTATYNAVKSAMTSHAKSLALQLAREGSGIRVNSLAPGSILFPGGGWERRVQADPEAMAEFVSRDIPSGRFGRPEEVASAAVYLCSPRASWITGASLNVDGGQSRSNI